MNWQRLTSNDWFLKLYGWKWHLVAMVAILFIGAIIAVQFSPQPPYAQLDEARLAISTARHAHAGIYAPDDLFAAEATWQRTRFDLQAHYTRWFFLRDFKNLKQLAALTMQQARLATQRAVATRDSLALVTIATMIAVKEKIAEYQSQYEEILLPVVNRGKLMHSALLLAECEAAFAREDFTRAAQSAHAALLCVSNASVRTAQLLDDYLANLKKWRNWVNETIAYSADQDTTVIIVDKLAHVCQIYRDGQLQAQYSIELGPRWLGQKHRKGDNATPEGKYSIIKKKENEETVYYKALEINYPNDEDRLRFEAAKKNGKMPSNAHPGGMIEIHGEGGKGTDWTAGCVALQNKDMDEVYAVASIGTPVTIVGSLNGALKKRQTKLATLRVAH